MANGDGWYPQARKLPITTAEYFGSRAVPITSIVNHITDGTDSRDWLQHANNGSSVHFLIREEEGMGVVYQFMPVHWAAWGNGRFSANNPYMTEWVKALIKRSININHATVSIEHERKWPFTTPLQGPMLAASIELHKWLADTYPSIERDREHIIGHYQIDHISRANCPGGPGGRLFPFDQIVGALQQPPPAPLPEWVHFPETGFDVPRDFYGFWVEHGGLALFGYPMRAGKEVDHPQAGKLWVQSFERARFERHPDGSVQLGRVEAERLECRGE